MGRLLKLAAGETGIKFAGFIAAIVVITSVVGLTTGSTGSKGTLGAGGGEFTQPLDESAPSGSRPASSSRPSGVSGGTVTGGTTVAGDLRNPSIPPALRGVDFGLKTQGVTAKAVKVGFSQNFDNCGDTASLVQSIPPGLIGDPKKAYDTFIRWVNEHGGVAGRKYDGILVDDGAGGGGSCQDRQMAAAIKMADEEKVFMAVPGLHVESDYIISRHVPVWGGRDDPASLQKYGPNGFQVPETITETVDAWASFGKYYLGTTNFDGKYPGCLMRIENGDSGNWDYPQKRLREDFAKYGVKFKKEFTFSGDASQAANTANNLAVQAKAAGCEDVYFLAGNPIGLIFITNAATKNQWFPHRWTWTSYTVLTDDDKIAKAMDQVQWENAVGLSARVPPGESKYDGNCKRIYEQYNNDGNGEAAWTKIACSEVLSTWEIMKRAIKLTGRLDANTFVIAADAIDNDLFYDAHVPIDFSIPGPRGPFVTRGFHHYTVADWNSQQSQYTFPTYPCYYKVFGPNKGGCEDLRKYYKK